LEVGAEVTDDAERDFVARDGDAQSEVHGDGKGRRGMPLKSVMGMAC
jgi:hypothetical protein